MNKISIANSRFRLNICVKVCFKVVHRKTRWGAVIIYSLVQTKSEYYAHQDTSELSAVGARGGFEEDYGQEQGYDC